MKDRLAKEFLEERLAATQAEAEHFQMQADTALKYAEQVWWSWNLTRQQLKIRSVDECILGYRHEDMEREDQFWWDRIHPEDKREVEESLEACFASKQKIWRCEHRFQDVTGEWVWVEQAGFVHQSDADGNPVEIVGTTRKTQERYQLLDLFRGSETLVDALSESSPVAFWVRDHEGVILLSSQALRELFGPLETIEDIRPLTPEKSLREWQEAFHSALQDNREVREMNLRLPKGLEKKVKHHLIPLTQGEDTFAVLEVFVPL